ncbi:MAG: EF-hand domain-containing protein [Rhodomicrobium sp.]
MQQTWILRYRTSFAALILALAAAGCGSTSPGLKEGVDGAFIRAAATWDLNHDGNVTCEEWRQYALSVFQEADTNHDGKLTPEEFGKLAKIDRLFLTANFAYYDTDKKGFVTQAEFVDKPNPAFLELDKDKTCVIKTYQLRAALSDQAKRTNPGSVSTPGAGGH